MVLIISKDEEVMYVNDVNYRTDLVQLQYLREAMRSMMSNPEMNQGILNLIASKIDCLDIGYDPANFKIDILIKKTTMRRAKGYKASSMYYYGVMNSVFAEYFERHPQVLPILQSQTGMDVSGIATSGFNSLCEIYCIGDKAVTIRF